MATQIQLRRGSTAQISTFTGAQGELVVDTTTWGLVVMDGVTVGGHPITAGGGSGTVTSVSVTPANGVSGTVLNPTTTPALTLSLGAITPTSVSASGAVTGSNLSGTNTGDQTITLTGDVTGTGVGSFAATLSSTAVTPGVYTLASITVDAKGRITAASSGTAAAGTVTSVSGSGGTTGLTLGGGPITDSGTLTLGGVLTAANGGTGASTLTGYIKGTGIGVMTAAATVPTTDLSGTINLATQVAGNLPVANLAGGVGASATTYWSGNGTWTTPAGGTGTDLTTSQTSTTVTVLSSTGLDVVLPSATQALAGVLTAADKLAIDNIPNVPVINDATTARTLLTTDNGSIIRFTNAGAIIVTVPTTFSGMNCVLSWQDATGTITVRPAAGGLVSINGSVSDVVLSGVRGAVSLTPTGTANSFDLQGAVGDLVAANITDSTVAGRALLTAADATAQRTALDAAAKTQATSIGALLEVPANKVYTLVISSPVGWTATSITAQTSAGTCSLLASINGVTMTGSSVTVTSAVPVTSAITAANVVAVGNVITVTVSAVAAAADLSLVISGTRVMA